MLINKRQQIDEDTVVEMREHASQGYYEIVREFDGINELRQQFTDPRDALIAFQKACAA